MQRAPADPSPGHLPSAPVGPLPLVSALPISKALISESDSVMASSGDARKNGLPPRRPGEIGLLPTPNLGLHGPGMQTCGRLSPCRVLPLPASQQHSSSAASTEAAHMHRRTWWPRQDSAPFDASSLTEQNGTSRLLVSALHPAVDTSKPPEEVLGTASAEVRGEDREDVISCDDESDQDQMLSPQQMDDSKRCSKRPAAVSAAWAVQQQATSCLHDSTQQCSESTQGPVLEGKDGVCQQLEDRAWPPLQAASTPQQQKEPAKQQQQRQQQQQTQGQRELALTQGDTAKVQYEAHRESQASKHLEQAQQQQQRCLSGIAAEQQYDCSTSSCSLTCSHAHQHLSNLPRNKDAALHLNMVPVSEPSEAHMDAVGPFPHRPGQSLCDFYARTGFCKFGQGCKFDHPEQFAVCLNSLGLPLRDLEATCPFYAKTGVCKFGPSCKFDHAYTVKM